MSLERVKPINPLRAALQAAQLSPAVQQAMATLAAVLMQETEAQLRARHGGEQVRLYAPKSGTRDDKAERNRRIRALAAPPSSMNPAQIAATVGNVTERHVRRILASGGQS